MATIVLVPGAGIGGWAWSRVTPLLEQQGHDVHAVTLTGLGEEDAAVDATQIDLHTYVDDLVGLLEREDLTDVVLVGHSFSGNTITGAAAKTPERIAKLVYLDAEIPQDGVSPFEAAGLEFEQLMVAIAQAAGDPDRLPWFEDDEILDTYFPGNEITAEDRAWMRANAAGHPLAAFRDRLNLPAEDDLPPRTYVTCLRRAFPGPIADDTPGWDHVTLDAGHWPMVTRPQETAELLDRIAGAR